MDCLIRLATPPDAEAISRVIIDALRESNAEDYPAQVIAQVEQSFSPEAVLGLLGQRRVYVAIVDHQVVATASLDRDVVRSVFVAPSRQGAGIGRLLMKQIHAVALDEGIEWLRVPSSITAEGFYGGLGYQKVREHLHGAERTIIMQRRLAR
ncbi:Predicted N-acetyltransferase YhbS [Pseudomonas sp. ok272]|uniref:GNAT family N-acetyltransferase n=1 Tax=unclassified Pseudomonas TaxID=196821 RepID=UPI0008C735E7|nr:MULTISPECIES: GNAT family N-acetyltransferase [unclassified Pseudomonas]SEN55775.1 Predicted N-acetyltransferase YhbS [Pseudomonas sp. ok272]SFN41646.1 Predicted N-acetyltransferase YhbS [Pseudomonas sp. ok602]